MKGTAKAKDIKKKLIRIGEVIIIAIVGIAIALAGYINTERKYQANPEIARSMEYDRVIKGEENIVGTDYVKFDAFFLRDLDGDRYADGIRGMCREVGQEDTLYMELNVLDNGSLKDAQITINSNNFYFQTAIVKDKEIANTYISNNTQEIKLNTIQNGTQKLIMGIVRSGDYSKPSMKTAAIGNDVNNYSKENSATLTGIHVADDGTETKITKTVKFKVDWHGITQTEIYANASGRTTSTQVEVKALDTLLSNNGLELSVDIEAGEIANELILNKSYIEGTLPRLNGQLPIKVEILGVDIKYSYNQNTGKFVIEKEATKNSKGIVTKLVANHTTDTIRYNKSTIKIIYPKECYPGNNADSVEIKIPVKAYYEGYNNTNEEFANPYKSNEAQTTIVKTWRKVSGEIYKFNVVIGSFVEGKDAEGKEWYYAISKEKPYKIYNKMSEREKDDRYIVRWIVEVNNQIDNIVMKESNREPDHFIKNNNEEDSMINVSSNIGIFFNDPLGILGENGWIKVYNDESNTLIETFTKDNWGKYNEMQPYYYNDNIKHVRVETSKTTTKGQLIASNVKELDDQYITTHYTLADFEKLEYIKTHFSGTVNDSKIGNHTVNYLQAAKYDIPVSIANINVAETTVTTQEVVHQKITISTKATRFIEQKWINGAFLVKLPSNIILAEINEVTIDNENVNIIGYDVYEEGGNYYIKVLTENKKESLYNLIIDCELTPNPIEMTQTKQIELYASNEQGISYEQGKTDQYDVNGNLNTKENVNYSSTDMSFIAPSSLITNQIGRNFDSKGNIVVAPQIAVVSKEQKTARIEVSVLNNYEKTISEIVILGKIPFEGNRTTITGKELGSTYTATMKNSGIEVQNELKGYATVYYSEKEEPTKDINNSDNGWKKASEVSNWNKIKAYLIDFGTYIMPRGKTYTFSYDIQLPEGLEYNEVAYSSHAIYFSLDTENGKYRTSTEPSKLGFVIAKKYELEITKYQEKTNKIIPGVTYIVTEEGSENSRIRVTNAEGKLNIKGLNSEKVYTIKEIKTPENYELKDEAIKFKTVVDENDNLQIQIIQGEIRREDIGQEEGEWKAQIDLENRVKAKLKINKRNEKDEPLIDIIFRLTGKGQDNVSYITDEMGNINVTGLYLNEIYTLEETRAEGYYFMEPVSFKVVSTTDGFNLEILSGEEGLTSKEIKIEDEIPIITFQIPNEKIPTYDLEILKVKKDDNNNTGLEGAQFKLEGERIEKPQYYMTDKSGKIQIKGLYQYVEGKRLEARYTLTEILAPEGYATDSTPIVFKAQVVDGKLQLQKESGNIKHNSVAGDKVQITVENSPIFNLTKYTKDGAKKVYLPNAKFTIHALDADRKESLAKDVKGNVIGEIEEIKFTSEETYPWIEENGVWHSTNQGKGGNTTTMTSNEFTLKQKGKISFEWTVSSESSHDYVYYTIKNKKTNATIGGTTTKISGTTYGTAYDSLKWNKIEKELTAGTYTLSFAYRKDSSVDKGLDTAYVRNATVGEAIVSTDAKGNLSLSLPQGLYKVVEVEAPEGYQLAEKEEDRTYYFGVETSLPEKRELKATLQKSIGNGISIKSIKETRDNGYIIGGSFSGSTKLNNGVTVTSKGSDDGLVVKCDSTGTVLWAKTIGGSGSDKINSVTELNDGSYVVAGYFFSTSITLDNGTILSNKSTENREDAILIKYSNNGSVQWAKSVGGQGRDEIKVVESTTSDGGFIAAGDFCNHTLDNGVSVGLNGGIIKYNSNGTAQWSRSIGSVVNAIKTLAVTSDGGFIVGGEFWFSNLTLSNGTTLVISGSKNNGMIVKFSNNGTVQWGKSIRTASGSTIYSVIETSNREYIAVGEIAGNTNLDNGTTLSSKGNRDGIILKYNNSGVLQWGKSIGGTNGDFIDALGKTSDGGFIIGGYFASNISLENSLTVTSGRGIVKYNNNGVPEWIKKNTGTSLSETKDAGYLVGGDSQIIKYEEVTTGVQVPQAQSIEIENNLKQYVITTEVGANSSGTTTGGTITGNYNSNYPESKNIRYVENVTHGKNATKTIAIVPNTGYVVKQITLNGKKLDFTPDASRKGNTSNTRKCKGG